MFPWQFSSIIVNVDNFLKLVLPSSMMAVVTFLPVTPWAQAASTFKSNRGLPPFCPVFFWNEQSGISEKIKNSIRSAGKKKKAFKLMIYPHIPNMGGRILIWIKLTAIRTVFSHFRHFVIMRIIFIDKQNRRSPVGSSTLLLV